MRSFSIGGVKIDCPVALAPMAGVTDRPFRRLCREMGAGLLCTEMVSAKAILYRNRNTAALLATDEEERPIAVQLFGSEPEIVAEAAAMIENLPFDILDLNMGCPVPKVVNNGEGSALLKDPARAAAIVRAVADRINKPVTVKMRRGFAKGDAAELPELARRLEEAGAAALTIHGRTREQYYSGRADWDCIRKVKEAVSIPVIGNGDVDSATSASALFEQTGCDAVAIGRAAQGNPWVFREILAGLAAQDRGQPEGEKTISGSRPDAEEIACMALRHAEMLIAEKGEYTGVREMRKHAAWYLTGQKNAASYRRQAGQMESLSDLQKILKDFTKFH